MASVAIATCPRCKYRANSGQFGDTCPECGEELPQRLEIKRIQIIDLAEYLRDGWKFDGVVWGTNGKA